MEGEYTDLGNYNGYPDHDMMVDYTCNQHTDELSELFDESDDYSERPIPGDYY